MSRSLSSIFGWSKSDNGIKDVDEYGSPLFMGLEIELENHREVPPSTVSRHWNAILDNSLRNSGIEFVNNAPKRGSTLLNAIHTLFDFIGTQDYRLSHRCSLHCHIDFRGADEDTLKKFFILYMLLEPALYTVSSKDRYHNIYCPGLSHTTEVIQQAAIGFYEGKIVQLARGWCKYTGINLHRLSDLGTVEIRTHHGSLDRDDVINWTRILNYMYTAAVEFDEDALNKVSAPDELVAMVFPPDLRDVMYCGNLQRYWDSAKLNLAYFNVMQQTIYKFNTEAPSSTSDIIRRIEEYVRTSGRFQEELAGG